MPKITTNNLFKYYVDKKKSTATAVLYDVNLTVPDGSFTVIMGPSGCGKTTLLMALVGITDVHDGKIFYNDADVTDLPVQNRNVSYCTQEYALYPHLTVFDNVAYPLKTAKVPADEIRRRVEKICLLTGIRYLTTRRPKELSGGQQQRVSLARALVKEPDVLFLDEPMSNYDEKLREDAISLFKKLHETLQITFVYVTHNVKEALKLADYLVVMDNGSVTAQGQPAELLQKSDIRAALGLTEKFE